MIFAFLLLLLVAAIVLIVVLLNTVGLPFAGGAVVLPSTFALLI
ncbi:MULTISPECIES: hypothetical protein [unclassified Microbacterium]|nr:MULTISPECIES: hypothetical protein [unclassified Microbacterium]